MLLWLKIMIIKHFKSRLRTLSKTKIAKITPSLTPIMSRLIILRKKTSSQLTKLNKVKVGSVGILVLTQVNNLNEYKLKTKIIIKQMKSKKLKNLK